MKQTTKTTIACVMMALLLFASGFAFYHFEYDRLEEKEQELNQIKLYSVAEMEMLSAKLRNSTEVSFDKHIQAHLKFMTSILENAVTEEGYTGPRLFADGAVVELRGDEVLWPDGMLWDFSALAAEDIREGRRVRISTATGPELSGEQMFLLDAERLADNLYYVDWTDENELLEDKYAYLKDEDFLAAAGATLEGVLLQVSLKEGQLPFVYESGSFPGIHDAAQLGFTKKMIEENTPSINYGDKTWLCTYATLEEGETALIYMKPATSITIRALLHTSTFLVSSLIIFLTLITYILSVVRYIRDHDLSRRQASWYHPHHLRSIVVKASVIGGLAVFISTAVYVTMDTLHEESISAARTLSSLFEYQQNATVNQFAHQDESEAEWNIYHGECIASLIAENPFAGTREKLQEYCDIFDFDYIMLFDEEGRETACSADYSGFTMDAGLGENSADFRRLLMGVPSIVHEAYYDPVVGLNRQYIGVKIPSSDKTGNSMHGALVMAIRPTQVPMSRAEISQQFDFVNPDERLFCYVDQENGQVMYASNTSLIGKTVTECGMPENSLTDGFTDFARINGVRCYVTMVKQAAIDFFYIVKSSVLFSSTLPASLEALACYILSAALLFWFCLRGYDPDFFIKCIGADEWETGNVRKEKLVYQNDREKHIDYTGLLVSEDRSIIKEKDKTPEQKASMLLRSCIFVLIVARVVIYYYNDTMASMGTSSLIHFILNGDWVRGVNLFSFCGILEVIVIGIMLRVLSNWILSLIAGFTGKAGETLCRLLYSLVNYIVILTILYHVFDFIGLPMSTYIASLGMVSLALSIGSKDMIADILAGLLIVFENQFQVGDIVEIDGYRGRILDIGIRSTRVLGGDNDVRFFNNSTIHSIINKSKRNSACSLELNLVTRMSLEEVEEFFKRELPNVAQDTSRILDGPSLVGITNLSGGGKPDQNKMISVRIKAVCKEQDCDEVKTIMRREIYLLCEREGIELGMAMP